MTVKGLCVLKGMMTIKGLFNGIFVSKKINEVQTQILNREDPAYMLVAIIIMIGKKS